MVPVIGIVQISHYAHADRYTYLPQIGLYLLLAWTAADLCAGRRYYRRVLGGLSVVILVALIFCARLQTSYWRTSETLWTHTLACTSGNYIAHYNLGLLFAKMGRTDEAIAHLQKALNSNPCYAEAHNNLGILLAQIGRSDEAVSHFQKALESNPDYAEAHSNLGLMLANMGRTDEAIARYCKALAIQPDAIDPLQNLAYAYVQKGHVTDAVSVLQNALASAESAGDEARATMIAQILAKLYETINPSPLNSKTHAP